MINLEKLKELKENLKDNDIIYFDRKENRELYNSIFKDFEPIKIEIKVGNRFYKDLILDNLSKKDEIDTFISFLISELLGIYANNNDIANDFDEVLENLEKENEIKLTSALEKLEGYTSFSFNLDYDYLNLLAIKKVEDDLLFIYENDSKYYDEDFYLSSEKDLNYYYDENYNCLDYD